MGFRAEHGDLAGITLGPELSGGARASQPAACDDYPLDLHEHQG
jgi:hypothetical protein